MPSQISSLEISLGKGSDNSHSSGEIRNKDIIEDPFVTNGLIAISLLTEKPYDECSSEELHQAAKRIVSYYLTPAFSKELYSLFPNGKYINPSVKDKRSECLKFLEELIDKREISKDFTATCQLCGRPALPTEYARDKIPLVGSGAFANYFPSYQTGIHVCPRCVLAIQFAPLIFYKIGGKPSLVSSSNHDLLMEYGKEAYKELTRKIAANLLENRDQSAIFDEEYKAPENAVFHLVYKFGKQYHDVGTCSSNETIVLYRIDNYLQGGSGVTIYKLPSGVFSFVAKMMHNPESKTEWFSFIHKYYAGKTKDGEDIRKTGKNIIHVKLLNNESILKHFKDDIVRYYKAGRNKDENGPHNVIPFTIIESYMVEVRRMHKERVEKIKEFADRLSDAIHVTNSKKRVNGLVSAKSLEEFRNQIRLIMTDWQKLGKPDPLIGYDDFITVIIPGDYRGWTEVRDLIVIRMYEKLHDILAKDADEES